MEEADGLKMVGPPPGMDQLPWTTAAQAGGWPQWETCRHQEGLGR